MQRYHLANRNRRPLGLETLEGRQMCAGVTQSGEELLINATNGGDKVTVSYVDNDPNNEYDDQIKVVWKHGNKTETFLFDEWKYIHGNPGWVPAQNITRITFNGGNGKDRVEIDVNISATLRGGKGNDYLEGGSQNDRIEGGLGSDTILGQGGPDHLWANAEGAGADAATDIVMGGQGNDHIYGGRKGVNFLYGDEGNDDIFGGNVQGVNHIFGGEGDDEIFGGDAKYNTVVTNFMHDTEGADHFFGGDYALNYYFCKENDVGSQNDDNIHLGRNSYDYWSRDMNKEIYDGVYVGDRIWTWDGNVLPDSIEYLPLI